MAFCFFFPGKKKWAARATPCRLPQQPHSPIRPQGRTLFRSLHSAACICGGIIFVLFCTLLHNVSGISLISISDERLCLSNPILFHKKESKRLSDFPRKTNPNTWLFVSFSPGKRNGLQGQRPAGCRSNRIPPYVRKDVHSFVRFIPPHAFAAELFLCFSVHCSTMYRVFRLFR